VICGWREEQKEGVSSVMINQQVLAGPMVRQAHHEWPKKKHFDYTSTSLILRQAQGDRGVGRGGRIRVPPLQKTSEGERPCRVTVWLVPEVTSS
jgi:hypothetical protein